MRRRHRVGPLGAHAPQHKPTYLYCTARTGVGMSYSEHASDYVVDDARTAEDADAFLRGWFRRFPQYGNNDFYVSGTAGDKIKATAGDCGRYSRAYGRRFWCR